MFNDASWCLLSTKSPTLLRSSVRDAAAEGGQKKLSCFDSCPSHCGRRFAPLSALPKKLHILVTNLFHHFTVVFSTFLHLSMMFQILICSSKKCNRLCWSLPVTAWSFPTKSGVTVTCNLLFMIYISYDEASLRHWWVSGWYDFTHEVQLCFAFNMRIIRLLSSYNNFYVYIIVYPCMLYFHISSNKSYQLLCIWFSWKNHIPFSSLRRSFGEFLCKQGKSGSSQGWTDGDNGCIGVIEWPMAPCWSQLTGNGWHCLPPLKGLTQKGLLLWQTWYWEDTDL